MAGPRPGSNRLLAALPAAVRERLGPLLERVPMRYGEVFAEVDARFAHVDFPTVGVISAVLVMEDGPTIEVGTVGNEGMAGLPVFLGAERHGRRRHAPEAGPDPLRARQGRGPRPRGAGGRLVRVLPRRPPRVRPALG